MRKPRQRKHVFFVDKKDAKKTFMIWAVLMKMPVPPFIVSTYRSPNIPKSSWPGLTSRKQRAFGATSSTPLRCSHENSKREITRNEAWHRRQGVDGRVKRGHDALWFRGIKQSQHLNWAMQVKPPTAQFQKSFCAPLPAAGFFQKSAAFS
jgi:hypothetical protein